MELQQYNRSKEIRNQKPTAVYAFGTIVSCADKLQGRPVTRADIALQYSSTSTGYLYLIRGTCTYVLILYQVQGGLRRDGLPPACGSTHARDVEASENVDRLAKKTPDMLPRDASRRCSWNAG